MTEQKSKTWYVGERGELTAKQFLLELGAAFFGLEEIEYGLDFMAFYPKSDGSTLVFGVEVKATEKEVDGKYPLTSDNARHIINMNIPVLLIVANVKENIIHFNWIKDAFPSTQTKFESQKVVYARDLRAATKEERERLKLELQSM